MIVYYNGKYLQKTDVAISPDDRGFLFADGIYEVIRAYRGKLFRCAEHFHRMANGLKELRIEGVEPNRFEEISHRLIAGNQLAGGDALIYMQVTRGAAPRSHEFPPAGTPPTIYVEPKPFQSPIEFQTNGVTAILAPDLRWSRCDVKTVALLPSVLAHQRAKEAGAFEAIFSRDGLLQEGTHSSILFVKEDTLICPPLTHRVLPSVTRNALIELALAARIEVELRPCQEADLFSFDEIIMAGTSVEIVPITTVNGRQIRDGYVGPVTRQLQQAFRDLIRAEARRKTVGPGQCS